ncbi:GNAT family N-acetyltransferase [Paucibacter soli]|uniref:GNAT family N-acetyltransferase n=1 Tax=Paucibacter soli TaxID=3133433 RepID=UPI0030A339AB
MAMIEMRDVDPQGEDALALLREAAADARALYPELFVGALTAPTNGPLPERGVYVVAYLDERPLACGAFRPLDQGSAEIRRIYVHREHRRAGLAKALLAHLAMRAAGLGYRRLVLETGYKQLPAMRLYESCGYSRIAAFGEYANDPTSVCYERLLQSDEQDAGRAGDLNENG